MSWGIPPFADKTRLLALAMLLTLLSSMALAVIINGTYKVTGDEDRHSFRRHFRHRRLSSPSGRPGCSATDIAQPPTCRSRKSTTPTSSPRYRARHRSGTLPFPQMLITRSCITWSPADDPFEMEKTYIATITVRAAANAAFADNAGVTMMGISQRPDNRWMPTTL